MSCVSRVSRCVRTALAGLAIAAVAGTTGAVLGSQSDAHVTHVRIVNQTDCVTVDDLCVPLPPYWKQDAPSDCEEDQPCWIGTKQDGRPDTDSLYDWYVQLHASATIPSYEEAFINCLQLTSYDDCVDTIADGVAHGTIEAPSS